MIAEARARSTILNRRRQMSKEASRPAVILYVEENHVLLETVRDVLEFAGWYVKRFDAGLGYALIESPQHFDLLLID
jgi:hypothetical protein